MHVKMRRFCELWLIIISVLPKYLGLKRHGWEVMDGRAQRIKTYKSRERKAVGRDICPPCETDLGTKQSQGGGLLALHMGRKTCIWFYHSRSPFPFFTAQQPPPPPLLCLITPSKSISSSPMILFYSQSHALKIPRGSGLIFTFKN